MPGPAHLRARILASLSIPATLVLACGGGTTPPEVPLSPTPSGGGAPDAGARVTAETPSGRTCGADEVLESVCGTAAGVGPQPYPYAACPPNPSALRVTEAVRLPVNRSREEEEAPEPSSAPFTFDATQTEEGLKRLLGKSDATYERAGAKSALCCYVRCTPIEVAMVGDPAGPGSAVKKECFPAPNATRAPSSSPPCPAAVRLGGRMSSFASRTGDRCCYDVTMPGCEPGTHRMPDGTCRHYYRGRPIREGGAPVVAETRASTAWAGRSGARAEAPPEVLAAWARAAATEHASVASFARLALDLLALGAPSELVRACHVAGLEEIDHAERSYALASRFAGTPLGPAPLPLTFTGPARRVDLPALLLETFVDGCVGETVAALEAEEARARAEDDEVRATLDVVAKDEASHATFAFRLVAWALASGGAEARAALARGVADVTREIEAGPPPAAASAPLARWGVLDEGTLAAVRWRALRDVVLPCARALLEGARRVGPAAAHVT